ncbi:MAG: hypothetical protein WB679_23795 [Terracidiphilus sp.]
MAGSEFLTTEKKVFSVVWNACGLAVGVAKEKPHRFPAFPYLAQWATLSRTLLKAILTNQLNDDCAYLIGM